MPRKPRVLSSTGIYHIILRSVNQHIIFEEASDYQKFLSILSDCKKKYDIDIYAYCLMGTGLCKSYVKIKKILNFRQIYYIIIATVPDTPLNNADHVGSF